VTALILGMGRALPAVLWAPLPWAARLILAAILTGVAWPALVAAPSLASLPTEVMAGLALGLVASVPFRAAEAAGATLSGAASAGRAASKRPGALSDAFGLFALALFAATGGPLMLALVWGESYLALPVGRALTGGLRVASAAGGRLIGVAIALALPALGALLLAELLGGLLVRVQPQVRSIGGGGLRLMVTLVAVAAGVGAMVVVLAGAELGALGPALREAARQLAP
jgi:flagellar biosynthetic protein FliR